MKTFGNVLTAMITPFTETGEVNYESAARIAEYLVQNGSDGLVVAGSTGEGAVMSFDEKVKLFATIVETVGKDVPVIANTGSNSTANSVELTKAAEEVGVTGMMAVVPYYNKPTQEGCYQHFSEIAKATSLPIIVYNVPGRTSSNILPETVARLANEHENIAAVKEASGDMVQISEIARLLPENFMIYSGDDSMLLPILAVGGVGVISVVSHVVGTEINEMVQAFQAGDTEKAQKLHVQLLPIMRKMFFRSNPIPIKEAMNLIGQPGGDFRLPLVHANEEEMEFIREVLKDYKKI